jgi:hypothetical protein
LHRRRWPIERDVEAARLLAVVEPQVKRAARRLHPLEELSLEKLLIGFARELEVEACHGRSVLAARAVGLTLGDKWPNGCPESCPLGPVRKAVRGAVCLADNARHQIVLPRTPTCK